MVRLDYECRNGHVFEKLTPKALKSPKCPECGAGSEVLWLASKSPHRQLQTPVVMWRYADGSLGVAGGADSKTPKNADRVELRTLGEVRSHLKELNSQHRSIDSAREERYMEAVEHYEHQRRSNLAHLMGNESDAMARDIYRHALERHQGGDRGHTFREYFSEVGELDATNRDGDRGRK